MVPGDVVHNRPFVLQQLGQLGVGDFSPQQENAEIIDAFVFCKRLGDFTRHVFVRHQIDLQVQFPELRRRRRPHCGDAHAADVAEVLKCLEEIIEKRRDAVGAGEDEPIVSVQPAQRLHNSLVFRRRNDFDCGDFQYLRPALE